MSPALQPEAGTAVHLLDNWFDAIEVGLHERVREFIQAMIESELEVALARPRYGRRPTADIENGDMPNGIVGHRHGHRSRSLMGTFGRVEIDLHRTIGRLQVEREFLAGQPAISRVLRGG
jgi:hypothetical protein